MGWGGGVLAPRFFGILCALGTPENLLQRVLWIPSLQLGGEESRWELERAGIRNVPSQGHAVGQTSGLQALLKLEGQKLLSFLTCRHLTYGHCGKTGEGGWGRGAGKYGGADLNTQA